MLQVAAMSEKKLSEAMTIPETEERLGKILELHIKGEGGRLNRVGLDSWRLVSNLETRNERIAAVQPASDLLAHLSFRCFPTYRPIIRYYLEILSDLAEGETEEIDMTMEALRADREEVMRRHSQLVDLLDWHHLASVTEESGEFEDYLRVREQLRKSAGGRSDPINQYLDQAQKIFAAE